MGLVWRKALSLGKRSRLNLSKSGGSLSHRRGPVTVNSKRRGSIRLPFGLSFRFKALSLGPAVKTLDVATTGAAG
jgi:hypothetical protein